MTCDEVGELLPEHLLGTIEGPEDLEVRRHLRGCAGCRTEMAALADGLASFAQAAHDRTPPPELRERVTSVLEHEWREWDERPPHPRERRRIVRPAAAVLVVLVALSWGGVQTRRANLAEGAAASYRNLLTALGGTEFRIGRLAPATGQPVEGSVVLYDSSIHQSWGVVLVRAPGVTGTANVTLATEDGRTIDVRPIEFQTDGSGATWIVTASDLTAFDRVTIAAPDGTVLAAARITVA